jgi:hypothetical protein
MTSSSSAPGIAYLDGPRLRRPRLAAGTHAREARAELNRLDAFPVPDGDLPTLSPPAPADILGTFRLGAADGGAGVGVVLASGLLATFTNVEPLPALDAESGAEPAGRVPGENRVFPGRMKALASRIPDHGSSVRFGVVQMGAPEVVQPVSERLRRRRGPDVETLTAPATPVIATHLGTGARGVAGMVDD